MMKFRFRRQGTDPQREKIKQELFAFNKTVEHGFPHQPSALAFDPKLQLMAIGTKSGAIKMYPLLLILSQLEFVLDSLNILLG
ncbi:Lethal(2) giant larvae protein 1 [Characodon lateralis]|uniref:Lethal(2) giant larvae protein 1 n=1 Tax=Characodon lateralis TaxID=208331 RepID=A0ABU7CVJ1_9TELE|nr:Lethal(2) giant larvae protein 1 [Characodon lateralis]